MYPIPAVTNHLYGNSCFGSLTGDSVSPFIFETALQREGTPEGELCHSLLNGEWQSGLQFDYNLSRLVLGAATKKNVKDNFILSTASELLRLSYLSLSEA